MYLQELVGSTQEKKNWRGIVIALLVIVVVFALVTAAIFLVTPSKFNACLVHCHVSFRPFTYQCCSSFYDLFSLN